jgi:glycosyltransferase involved in cell wall biosynthesis
MRIGQNPAKSIPYVAQPERVTVAIVTYIPVLGGYYQRSLDVLKVCLNSLRENADNPFDLLVFDNGSCPEVRTYLTSERDQDRIQYLVLSDQNVGKAGAWNFIFSAAPGEFIAYADSDVYFYPGWLSAQLDVLETFPRAGMVTGMPMWTPEEFSTSTTQWAQMAAEVQVERGRFLPWDDYWRHARSLGADETEARQHFDSTENICLTHGDDRYYVGAAHFQFVARREALQSVLPIPSERPMGQVRLLDVAINERGYLRLCTSDWWVRHMGNSLQGVEADSPSYNPPSRHPTRRFWDLKPVRKLLRWLYHHIFEILYKD